MVDDLAELVFGEVPRMTGQLWEKMHRAVGFIRRQGVTDLAMSTLDTACWDIAANSQVTRVPLAGRRQAGDRGCMRVRASGCRSVKELVSDAESFLDRGFGP